MTPGVNVAPDEPPVAADLAAFLDRHTPFGEAAAVWGGGTLPLRIRGYLSEDLPPLEYVTSVRCVVFRGDSVLVMRNQDGSSHVIPGGRRGPGETLQETLERELLEETGWTAGSAALLGFVHIHHLSPKPADHPYPYPDFVWAIYVAEAVSFSAAARLPGDYEVDASFQPIEEARAALPEDNRLWLAAALAHRRRAQNVSPPCRTDDEGRTTTEGADER